jgi:hypothetical protein
MEQTVEVEIVYYDGVGVAQIPHLVVPIVEDQVQFTLPDWCAGALIHDAQTGKFLAKVTRD